MIATPFWLCSKKDNRREMVMPNSDNWHRRQAVAIASTLPEDLSDARIILQLTMELLDGFLAEGKLIRTGECARASRPLRGDA
jgi:hypothetical protein